MIMRTLKARDIIIASLVHIIIRVGTCNMRARTVCRC